MDTETQHHGSLKQRPEDFQVDEIPLYAPSGEGEHLFLGIRKTNISHEEMVLRLAKAFGVSKREIGTAGRKDRVALTSQVVSIHLPGRIMECPMLSDGLEVLWQSQHDNKLRIGHLIGNLFDIRLREIDPMKVTQLRAKIESIQNEGMPNAYGPQRFGNQHNNHLLGLAYLKGDWGGMLTLLECDSHFVHLKERKSPKDICKGFKKQMLVLWVQAFQSFLFNECLEARIANETWNVCQCGDLIWSHVGKGSSFLLTEEELQTGDIQERQQKQLISPTGPMWGTKMRMPEGETADLEKKLLESHGITQSNFEAVKKFAKGSRRPLRVPVQRLSLSGGVDEHGDFIRVQMEMPAGSYATVLINQLLSALP